MNRDKIINYESYSSLEIIKILESHGWYCVKVNGDHWQFKHHFIVTKVTVTHPVKDVIIEVVKDIEKKTGIKF